ncbi:pimeloyl-CoA dehydrogenase [Niastella koreensis]|uniref:Pirin domain protein n=2 Tax=Niastella koreensis TaxID=354356 RepID=G8T941_NIAKG|nr:pirin family protein [Niastella koreensis]AEV96994.1 Pirin domain protein [Niastella koreensis GR20-10]OQP39310.1 pimeloyl-CoA dehydrogenase [Niastella koreensis]
MLQLITNQQKIVKNNGGFGIEILFPGKGIGSEDSGIGTIGRIDQATVTPGTLVPMHPHKDDEILTYLRSGVVQHKDTEGNIEVITNKRLMMMNAGAQFQHEELVLPEGGVLTALQIFIRPEIGGLIPKVQFYDFPEAISRNEWREVAGKDDTFPLQIRSNSWIYDIRLEQGKQQSLPVLPLKDATCLVYLFDGLLAVNENINIQKGESLVVEDEKILLKAVEDCNIVLFVTDRNARVFKEGMYSGNINRTK